MSEDNVKRQIQFPWVSFGSVAASMSAEGDFLRTGTHPRAYGNFARLLGKYVRDEHVIPLAEAIKEAHVIACGEPPDQGARPDRSRLLCRPRDFRSADHRRSCNLREPASVRDGRSGRVGKRRPGLEKRRAHGTKTGPKGVWSRRAGAGNDGLTAAPKAATEAPPPRSSTKRRAAHSLSAGNWAESGEFRMPYETSTRQWSLPFVFRSIALPFTTSRNSTTSGTKASRPGRKSALPIGSSGVAPFSQSRPCLR